MSEKITLFYTAKPISYERINDEFTKMRCYVLATGKNANYSRISREAVDKAISTLYNIPVVAHLKQKDDGGYCIGGHDRQIVIEDNSIFLNDLTVPFGVVPETNNIEYVNIIEQDGKTSEYLVCDIILWTGRYGEIMDAAYSEEIYFGQSMEIIPFKVQPLEEDDRYIDVQDFEFSALCLLGKSDDSTYHTEPCFPSACVKPVKYELDEQKFTDEFSILMKNLKMAYSSNENNTTEKGGELMDEKIELLDEAVESESFSNGQEIEEVEVAVDGIELEEIEVEFSEDFENEEDISLRFATYNTKRSAIISALSPVYGKNEEGDIISYTEFWLCDFDDKYVYVEMNSFDATNGKENSSLARMEYSYDEKLAVATISNEFDKMVLVWMTVDENAQRIAEEESVQSEFSDLSSEFENYKSEFSYSNKEVDALIKFRDERLMQDRNDAIAEIFDNFDKKLSGVDEYEQLKQEHSELEISEIENRCFTLVGRKEFKFTKVSKPVKVVKISVDNSQDADDKSGSTDDPYGGVIEKYGKIRRK